MCVLGWDVWFVEARLSLGSTPQLQTAWNTAGPVMARFSNRLAASPGARVMDQIGLAASLFDEGQPGHGSHQADLALASAQAQDSTSVTSRLNALLVAARSCTTSATAEVYAKARDLSRAQPTTIAA